MIKIEKTEVVGWEAAIRGMRNAKNSWDRSDSDCVHCMNFDPSSERDCETCDVYIGPNDLDLMMRLAKGGPVHAKYLRYIDVYVDVTAPLYWWKEFETYRIGVAENPSDIEMNSCSTMHKIHDKEFTLEDFSHEHLIDYDLYSCAEKDGPVLNCAPSVYCGGLQHLNMTINVLNYYRRRYLKTKLTGISKLVKNIGIEAWNDIPGDTDDEKRGNLAKKYWWQMIQLLPSSYNQKRTLKMNYQVLAGIYPMRKNHKLDEWREFCDWIETLPYSEIITGKNESEELFKIGEALHKGMEKGLVDVWKKANPGMFVDEWPVSQEEFKGVIKDWNELVDKVWKEAFPNDLEDDSSGTHDFLKKKLNIVSPSDEKENKE